ncbi:hypothetical protein [uncultured Tessaracoccus sp.]|uniref:hypothetical protein n=1 Tax=uncultured Tessaracoccus sp. TaxID=905023 RepID=UPI0026199FDC|nr:hypothetical protein [uncultured Tessaracoccus sp.]
MNHPNNPQWPGQPPHESVKLKKPGTGFMIFGSVLIVVALILGVGGFVGGLSFAIPNSDEVQRVDGSLKVQLAEGEERTVWRPEGSNVACRVLDESGEPVDMRLNGSLNFTNSQGSFVSIGKFAGKGEYTVECEHGVGAVSPPLGLEALLGGIGALLLGLFVGFAGVVVLIIGLVIRVTRRR